MSEKRSREIDEMVAALERHVRLLIDYAASAFDKGNSDFGGEIAGKLRLLVTKSRSNRPLLLDLMTVTGIEPPITLGGPPMQRFGDEPISGDKVSLQRYMQLNAIGLRVSPERFVVLSKTKMILAWAEQTGSAHEDWSHDPELDLILTEDICLGGLPAAFAELKVTTETVVYIACQFLSEYYARAALADT